MTPTLDALMDMRHRDVLDANSEKIGELVEVYFDKATRTPEWVGIGTSLFGMKRVLAPVLGARIDDEGVHVAYAKDAVLDTPAILDREISQDVERHLYEHYGIEYSFEGSPTGLPRDAESDAPAAHEEHGGSAPDGAAYLVREVTAWQWPDAPMDGPMRLEELPTTPAAPVTPLDPRGYTAHAERQQTSKRARLASLAQDAETRWFASAAAAFVGSVVLYSRDSKRPGIVLRGVALALLCKSLMEKRRHMADDAARLDDEPLGGILR